MKNKKTSKENKGGLLELHEKTERQIKGLELGDEISDRSERAKVERHDKNLGLRTLRHDTSFSFFSGLEAPSRKNQSGSSLG